MTQPESPELTKLKKKILALLAKAERTDNEHEAASFGAKARALMEEHQLTMAQLDQTQDELGRTLIVLKYGDACWVNLAASAATYLGCYALLTSTWQDGKSRKAIIFVGRASARAVAEIMYPFWYRCCLRAGQRLHKERGLEGHPRRSIAEVAVAFAIRLSQLTPIIARESLREAESWDKAQRTVDTKHHKIKVTRPGLDTWAAASQLPVDMQLG